MSFFTRASFHDGRRPHRTVQSPSLLNITFSNTRGNRVKRSSRRRRRRRIDWKRGGGDSMNFWLGKIDNPVGSTRQRSFVILIWSWLAIHRDKRSAYPKRSDIHLRETFRFSHAFPESILEKGNKKRGKEESLFCMKLFLLGDRGKVLQGVSWRHEWNSRTTLSSSLPLHPIGL